MDTFDIRITHCTPETFEEMVTFIASLNSNAADHIGYFDATADDLHRSLTTLTLPVGEGFRLAIANDHIVGVLGVEADADLGRAWLYGPLIQHT
jgi:hypothetical protein